MIDIHCHLLPGVDDGAGTPENALAMARIAVESGVETVIVTPHCNIPGDPMQNYLGPELKNAFYNLRAALQQAGIPLNIMPGMEIMCTEETPELICRKKMLSLAGSRYILLEFFFDTPAHIMTRRLQAVAKLGLVPVIAHPERYHALQDDPLLAERWFSEGFLLQVNRGSILGELGPRAEVAADLLLSRRLAHVVASDGHNPRFRTTRLDDIKEYIADIYSPAYAELLLERNPMQILTNRPVVQAAGNQTEEHL